jgi:hypothetical protein
MYRIEVATGEETVFRTVEELATGIRNGLITPRSRIYHAASQKWLPIEFHPHYKKAVNLVTGGAPMIDTGLTRPPMASSRRPTPVPVAAPRQAAAPPTPVSAPAPPPPPPPAAAIEPPRPVAPRPEQRRFGPSRFGPPAFEPPRAEPPTYTAPAFEQPRQQEPVAVAPPPAVEVPTVDIPLPRISYPEVEPSSEPPQPVARRRATGSTPLALGGLVVVALIGGYFATSEARAPGAEPAAATAAPEARAAPEPVQADPAPEVATEEPVPPPPASVPAASTAKPPMQLKLLEPAPRPTGPVSQAWSSSAGAIAPVPAPAHAPAAAPAAALPGIAPAPGALELALPKLPSADTIGSGARAARDSVALKRILRAVGGRPSGGKATR